MGVAAATALLALAPAAATASAAGKRTVVFKPARTSQKAVTFKLRGVTPHLVVRASLVRAGRVRRRIGRDAAIRAARRGSLRVSVRSSHGHRRMARIVGSAARKRTLWVRRSARSSVKLRVVTDTRAPDTRLTDGTNDVTESQTASFQFRSDEKRSTFECNLDDGGWSRCYSGVTYTDLADGDHIFSVRARDRAGNVDATPAVHSWTIESPAAEEPAPAADPVDTGSDSQPPVVDPGVPVTDQPAADPNALFADSFTGLDGVITNHYAFWSPDDSTAFRSPNWEMESGCALRRDNTLWTGVPTSNLPNRDCSNGSGSEVFRLWTKASFTDVSVTFSLRNNGFISGAEGERSWDGVKVWLRRQGGSGSVGLYTAEVNRRQGNILIQKKCAGSDVYNILAQDRPEGAAATIGEWEHVGGTVKTQPDGSVKLSVIRHGKTVLEATDTGVGCAPITSAGRVGVRGDYTDFNVDDFAVTPAV